MVSEISKILFRNRKFTWSCCQLKISCKFELPDLLIPSSFKSIDFWITTWKNIVSEASSFNSNFANMQIFIAHSYRCQPNIIRKILKNTLFEQTSIFKTNENPGRNQIMNIAHKRPIAFKISENDLWYFFFNSFNLMKVLITRQLQ